MTTETATPVAQAPSLDEQVKAKLAEIASLEKQLAEAQANMLKVAQSGDMNAIIGASLAVTKIEAPTGAEGQLIGLLPTARHVLQGLQTKVQQAAFDAKWDAVAKPLEQERERIKALFTDEIKAICAEFGYSRVSFDVDGFGSDVQGVNVSLRRQKVAGSGSSSPRVSNGTRASRNASWTNGSVTYGSALDVVKHEGLGWAQSGNLKGDPSKGYEATAEGWVKQRVDYAKDASNLARQHGFSPVETPVSA